MSNTQYMYRRVQLDKTDAHLLSLLCMAAIEDENTRLDSPERPELVRRLRALVERLQE